MMEVKEKEIKHQKKPDWIRVKLPQGKNIPNSEDWLISTN